MDGAPERFWLALRCQDKRKSNSNSGGWMGFVSVLEPKYAASGVQSGTGTQKLAEVMLLTEQSVTALLAKAGVSADTSYIESVVSAVVAILNVQSASGATTAAA